MWTLLGTLAALVTLITIVAVILLFPGRMAFREVRDWMRERHTRTDR